MTDPIQQHTQYMTDILKKPHTPLETENMLFYHETKLRHFQHERLIHLLVTLTIGICLLLTSIATLLIPSLMLFIITGLLLVLFLPYIIHYRTLENGVQKLYQFTDTLMKK